MSITLTPITRKQVTFTVTATLPGGSDVSVTGVEVALLPVKSAPDALTEWTTATFTAPDVSVILAGPDASDLTGALVVPGACSLWAHVTDAPMEEAVELSRVELIGGRGTLDPAVGIDGVLAALIADPTSAVHAAILALPTYPNGA